MREILLVRFGEVFLKGQNRPFFMKKLMNHIRDAVRPVEGRVWMSEDAFTCRISQIWMSVSAA